MRNLVIILILSFPLIGFGQSTPNEVTHSNSKIYFESGVEPFSKIYDKKQPTKVVATTTAATTDHQPKSHFESNLDECRTTRLFDKPKGYFAKGKTDRSQSTEVAANTTTTSDDQEFILPAYNEDDYKLGSFKSSKNKSSRLKPIADDFITIQVYENPKVYYEIKVPAASKKRLYTIHHERR